MKLTDEELTSLLNQCRLSRLPRPTELRTDQERRRERRWEVCDQFVTLYHRGSECCLPVQDISLSGMRVTNAPESLQTGNCVLLVMNLQEHGCLATRAQVRHRLEQAGVASVGLRFHVHHANDLLPLISYLSLLWSQALTP